MISKESQIAMQSNLRSRAKDRSPCPSKSAGSWAFEQATACFFESDSNGVHIRPVRNDKESAFAKYAGIGNPGIPSGKKAINRWLREVRGHND